MTPTRFVAMFSTAAALSAALMPAFGQTATWPTRPIKMLVSSPPGDGSDLMARVVGVKLQELLGQPIVIENKLGAGGIVGVMAAKNSPADGYTFLASTAGAFGINPAVVDHLPYDARVDFIPVMLVNRLPNVCVVNAESPVKTLADFIAMAKKAPGKYTFGSGGNGTSAHMNGEYLKMVAGIDLLHIPYRGASGSLQAVVGNQIDLFCGNLPPALPLIKTGRLRALAVTTPQRSPALPEVPTVAESGFPGFESVSWFGIFAAKGTPPDVVAKLSKALTESVATSFVRDKLAEQGTEVIGSTPADFKTYLDADIQRWTKVAKAINLHIEF